jgi:hypothetical protein
VGAPPGSEVAEAAPEPLTWLRLALKRLC